METRSTGRNRLSYKGIEHVSKLASQGPRPLGEIAAEVAADTGGKVSRADFYGLLAAANIPKRHSWIVPRTEDERSKLWWTAADKLLARVGGGCLVALLGPRGTGKTQAAVGAIGYGAKAQRTALYAKAFDVFLDVRATYARQDQAERDALEKYIRPDILVLDEIQQRGETVWEDRILAYLIDRRYDAMVDTILIGNLTPDALADSLDPSIVDRLRETGGILEFNWTSFRTEPAQSREHTG
jgi:Cdc6-like AAA superfamily ATPase